MSGRVNLQPEEDHLSRIRLPSNWTKIPLKNIKVMFG